MEAAAAATMPLSRTAAAASEFVRAIAEDSPAMLWMGDERGRCVFLNAALRDFWGVNPANLDDFDWSSTLHPDDIEMLSGPFAEAMSAHKPFRVMARYKRADGQFRTMRTEANPRFGPDGEFLGMTGVNTDISDQLAAEEHTRYLMGELNHRTKNILSVVQALAKQTIRDTPEQYLEALNARLVGLAASNDLLLKSEWSSVQLADLARAQLRHLGDLVGTRIRISGPPLLVNSRGTQPLGMALHELSTNSLKYGALSLPAGEVVLQWRRNDQDSWIIEWIEPGVGGAPVLKRTGFGHTLMIDMVAATFAAVVSLDFDERGLVWRALMPGNEEIGQIVHGSRQ